MNTSLPYCIVITTTRNAEDAETLAKKIVSEKLGACVQVQQIRSYYMWNGEACADAECLLLIKTKNVLYHQLEQFITANHSYDTPEIIQIPVEAGSVKYLNWIDEVTNA